VAQTSFNPDEPPHLCPARARRAYLLAAIAIAAAGCIQSSDGGTNDRNEIDCTGLVCDWNVKEGTPSFGATWHDGDLGVNLSADGRIVLELKDVLFATHSDRQLVLRAAMVRDPSATIAYDLDFFAPGSASGATFWDRAPVFLVTRHVDVIEQGVFRFHRPVLVPSEGAAVVLRVTKDGTGRAMFDELTLGQ
jgi:hypothetical protein